MHFRMSSKIKLENRGFESKRQPNKTFKRFIYHKKRLYIYMLH